MPHTRLVVKATPASRAPPPRVRRTAIRVLCSSAAWKPGCLDQLQGRQARRHRHRIAAERAGLVDRPARRDLFHQVALAAIGADRHAAADDLAEGGEVGIDAIQLLGAAERDPEAGHHLVEDQQRAVARAQVAQVLQVARRAAGCRLALPTIGSTIRPAMSLPSSSNSLRRGVEVVVGQGQREVGQRLRHAGRIGHAQGQRAGAGLDQEGIAVAVVAALELDDARRARSRRAPGGSPTSWLRCRS